MSVTASASLSYGYRASAIGWMPMWWVTMNSVRARPTPAVGNGRERKRPARIADDQHDLRAGRRHRRGVDVLNLERARAGVDMALRSLGTRDRDLVTIAQRCRASLGADDARQAKLPRDDGRVGRAAARVGDDGGHAPHHRLPVGIGLFGDEHFACLDACRARDTSRTTRTRPTPILSPTACPVNSGAPGGSVSR